MRQKSVPAKEGMLLLQIGHRIQNAGQRSEPEGSWDRISN